MSLLEKLQGDAQKSPKTKREVLLEARLENARGIRGETMETIDGGGADTAMMMTMTGEPTEAHSEMTAAAVRDPLQDRVHHHAAETGESVKETVKMTT